MRAMLLTALMAVGMLVTPAVAVADPAQAPYRNCTEAKLNGDCNIPSSSPYYQSKLDRDQDGIGCEC